MIDFSKYNLQIIIIAEDRLLIDSLQDNFLFSQPLELLYPGVLNKLSELDKIDIVFIDKKTPSPQIPKYKIRTIINMSGNAVCDEEITLNKPYKLSDVATILHNHVENNKLFISLGQGWIFNEAEARLQSLDNLIRLTEKENKIIHFLMQAKNMKVSKNELFDEVWQYSANSETSTLETHLYKLRQKLPEGMLKIENSYVMLCNSPYALMQK